MKKLRVLSTVCALSLLATMISSCGDNNATKTPNKEGKDSNTELIYWTEGNANGNNQNAIDAVNDYVKDKLGFTLKVNIVNWSDIDTKMNTILQSGEYFDFMFSNNKYYNKAVDLGAFADITEMIPKEAPELNKLIPEDVWNGVKINDKIYSVPTYKDSSLSQYWYFDKQYVDKYNLDVSKITTFEELDKALKTIKDGEGENFYPIKAIQSDPFNGFYNGFDGLCAGLRPLAVRMDDQNRKVINVYEDPQIIKQLEYMHKWFKEGIINPDAPTSTEVGKQRPFRQAQAFPGAENLLAAEDGVEAYVGVKIFGPMYSTESIQGSLNAIGKNSKYKEECLHFLELANTDHKLRDLMAYGAEGTDFEYVEDGVVKKLNDSYGWPMYTQATYFNMSVVEGTPKDQWDQVKKLNEEADKSSVLGFSLDVSKINSELTACKTVYEKYRYDLETGAKDPHELIPKMTEELNQAGFETVVQEAQKQIDKYFAK